MSVACPNGHPSETSDYCDQCGARIEGAAGTAAPPAPVATMARAAPPVPGTPPQPETGSATAAAAAGTSPRPGACPVCQTSRVGDDRFCEGCGYDFTSPPPAPGTTPTALATSPGSTAAPAWEAVAVADREYYDRVAPDGVLFPILYPPRRFLLAGDQVRIGRHSTSRGIQPEVDLSGAPEDGAISHLHCILIEQPDGAYALLDPGSTNGTTLNDDPTPLTANTAVALADGDRIHLGAWTTITIRARPPGGPDPTAA